MPRRLVMKFLHWDLGFVPGGSTAVVHLSGTEANVQLMDDFNFGRYRRGESHEYRGGHFRISPARVAVPCEAHWHVVVDLGGFGGSVNASVEVISPRVGAR